MDTGQGMRRPLIRAVVAALLAFLPMLAQAAQASRESTLLLPLLRPGEGLAIAIGEEVRSYGDSRTEGPLGDLAKLVWMRMEGADWAAMGVEFRCKEPTASGHGKAHGRLSLGRALQADCEPAFLAWTADARLRWQRDYGDAVARLRLEEVFRPFLGRRLPTGENLPVFTASWLGAGDLLRSSPEAFLHWLLEPQQAEVVVFGKRFLAGRWVEVKELLGQDSWWFKTATASVLGDPAATNAWVAGGRGSVLLVFRMPRGNGRPDAEARLRAILGLKP